MDPRVFPYGAIWGPTLPREEWANDLREMRKAGFNAVRIGIRFQGTRVLGHTPTYEETDEIVGMLREHGISFLMGLGTTGIPLEFHEKYPDIRFIDIDGQPFPRNIHDLTWPQACFNHPGYRNEIERFFDEAITHYKDQPHLLAWKVHNEPCNPWGSVGCYCEHTVASFRQWLEARYQGDLDAMNRLWQADFGTWEAIEAPRTMPKDGGNPTAWIDWMTFGEWNVTDFIRWETELVRAIDPDRMAGTNTMGGVLRPITTAQSERELAKVCDYIGMDWYPSWVLGRRHGEKAQMEKHVGAELAAVRWAVDGKRMWIEEVQAGPNAESIWFGPDEMRIEAWQAVAHGYKGLYWYRWDPIINGQEPWVHHMRDMEGQITERVDEAGRLSRRIGQMEDLIADSYPIQGQVAIYYSRPSKILAQGQGLYDPQYGQAINGTYRLFADNHYIVDWIDDEQILAGKLADYELLALPFAYCMSQNVADAIKTYVHNGGAVLAKPFCATCDENGTPYDEAPGAGLAEVFGLRATDVVNYRYWLVGHAVETTEAGAQITELEQGARFWLAGLKETVALQSDSAQVLLKYIEFPMPEEQEPALVVHPYGSGKAIYFAAGLGEAYTKMEMPYQRLMVGGLLRWLEMEKPVQVNGVPEAMAQDLAIMVSDAESRPDRTVFVINHSDCDVAAEFSVALRNGDRVGLRELGSMVSLPHTIADGRIAFPGYVPARDAAVFHLYQLDTP